MGARGGPLGVRGALESRVVLWEPGCFLRGRASGIGALWGWGRGPHDTVQMELVYYNDHRVSHSNPLLKSSFKSSFKMSLTVSPK